MNLSQGLHVLALQLERIMPDAQLPADLENALVLLCGYKNMQEADQKLLDAARAAGRPIFEQAIMALQLELTPVVGQRLGEIKAEQEAAEQRQRDEHEAKLQAERARQAESERQAAEARAAEMQALEDRAMKRALDALRAEQAANAAKAGKA